MESSGKMLGDTSLPERKKDEIVNSYLEGKRDKNSIEAGRPYRSSLKTSVHFFQQHNILTTPSPYVHHKAILLHVFARLPSLQ